MTEQPSSAGSPPRRWARNVGFIIGLAGFGFLVSEVIRNRHVVAEAWRLASPWTLGVILVVGTAGMTLIAFGWWRCLAALGVTRPLPDTLYRYFVGELGKYVPGGIWAVLGRGELTVRGGVPRAVSYGSTVLGLGMTYLAAMMVGLVAWGVGGSASGSAWLPWMILVVVIGIACLHPRIANPVLGFLFRLIRRETVLRMPSWGRSIGLLVLHAPVWLLIGGATAMLTQLFDMGEVNYASIVFATAVAWTAGFVAVPVPGGIGVREGVFVALADLDPSIAATVAVSARVLFVLADLLGAALWALWQRSPLGVPRSPG